MRDLFRFLFRQRNNLLFAALLALSMWLVVIGNMHQRAQVISSSNRVIGRIYTTRNEVTSFADLRRVNNDLLRSLAIERERKFNLSLLSDTGGATIDTIRKLRYTFIPAQVINSTTHKEKNYITLDKGSLDGLHADMGVIGIDGIVGMVRETSPHFAVVTSVLNPAHAASAQLKSTSHFGQLKWNTSDPRTVLLSDIDKHVPVAKGDTVVTRGSEGVYPPGIPVGIVEKVENDPSIPFHVIIVRLSEDLTRSGPVTVVGDIRRLERDSVEAKTGTE